MQAKLFRYRRALLENATSIQGRRARDLLLDLLEAGIEAADPQTLIGKAMQLDGMNLQLGEHLLHLEDYEHIWVVGLGKAAAGMARGVEKILGSRISGGCIAAPEDAPLKHLEVVACGYPIVDSRSIEAAEKIMTIARIAGPNDLVISLISGGGSALAELPIPGVTLPRLQILTEQLLGSGADIRTINAVRQVFSQFKGGGLARAVFPATHYALIISNVVGDEPQTIASGPTVPMSKPIAVAATVLGALPGNDDLLEILEQCEGRSDSRIRAFELDALKKRGHNILIGNNDLILQAICTRAKELGLEIAYLRNKVEGEASVLSRDFMRAVRARHQPRPQLFLQGGQASSAGVGAHNSNQIVALGCVRDLSEFAAGAALVSFASDGSDGGEAAGCIIDSSTLTRAMRAGLTPEEYMESGNASVFFEALADQLRPGSTGTSVGDLTLMVDLV